MTQTSTAATLLPVVVDGYLRGRVVKTTAGWLAQTFEFGLTDLGIFPTSAAATAAVENAVR